ncbi:GAF domain-containing protein [Planoprotostelium fungivorum]|uniref:GAF domain-containing protein n=1 Tax=Planoprotostelium fungivorum TaxID=1890364 RepID=A0A2P6NK86_9EUKA|nr:GAF domain-containing protein [Planoprotostelium fungivorum]
MATAAEADPWKGWEDAPKLIDDVERCAELRTFQFEDCDDDLQFISDLTFRLLGVEGSSISSMEEDQQTVFALTTRQTQWKKTQYPRKMPCSWTILRPKMTIVEDCENDAMWSKHPSVKLNYMKMYCGVPLTTSKGHNIGSFCLWDVQPRKVTETEETFLRYMGSLCVKLLEIHRIRRASLSHSWGKSETKDWPSMTRRRVETSTLAEALSELMLRNLQNEQNRGGSIESSIEYYARAIQFLEIRGMLNQEEFAQKLTENGGPVSMTLLWKIYKANLSSHDFEMTPQ